MLIFLEENVKKCKRFNMAKFYESAYTYLDWER